MQRYRLLPHALVLILLAFGCSGGCGCDGMTPIPGGFPDEGRKTGAVSVKLSKGAFDALEESIGPLVEDAMGDSLGADVPCVDATQSIQPISFLPAYDIRIFVCDLDDDRACTPADEDPALRVDQPGHGRLCGIDAALTGVSLQPTQVNLGSPVDIEIELQLQLNTGRIPLVVHNPCSLRCSVELDTDRHAPPHIPLTARVRLRLDETRGNILAFDIVIDDLMDNLDERELQFHDEGGSCDWGCRLLDIDFVKRMLFDRIQGMIEEEITELVDGFRCRSCDDGCPEGSACDASVGVCYDTDDQGNFLSGNTCPAAFLGMEGRMQLAELLGSFGGKSGAGLDLSLVAGGLHEETELPIHRVENGGLVIGMMAGSRSVAIGGVEGLEDRTPAHDRCVPMKEWVERPAQTPLHFDIESQTPSNSGESLAGYHLGFGIGDNFLDKLFFDAWDSGALCLNIDTESVDLLTTGLFSTFLPSLDVLTEGKDVPLMIALRPATPPNVIIGRGTTKPGPDGGLVPDDPLLTIVMDDLNLDFYAVIEERWSRLFTLTTDLRLPLALEIDTTNGTVTPALGALESMLTNSRASNSTMLSEDPSALAALIESLLGLAEPALGDGFDPIELPTGGDGFGVEIQALRGALKYEKEEGYEYLAGFARLELDSLALPATNALGVEARLVESEIPSVDSILGGAIPTAIIEARGLGVQHRDFRGHEFSYRVNGGAWSPWQPGGRLTVARPVMRLQGRHRIEVRAREMGVPESTSRDPVQVDFVVDHAAPKLKLEIDHFTRTVRTIASDAVADFQSLSFRYRESDGAWSGWGPPRHFALSDLGLNPALEAEVRDPAGHIASARFGDVSVVSPESGRTTGATGEQPSGGCTHQTASLLSVLGLLALRRRRKHP